MIYIHSIALYSGQNKKGLELQHAVNEYDKALFDHFKWEWFTDYLKILMRGNVKG